MVRGMHALSLVGAALALGACGGYDNGYYDGGYPAPGPQALVEVFHASSDAPRVDVLLDGTPLYTGLDYAQGTGQMPVDATVTHTLAVQAETPGAPITVIGPISESFTANTVYTVVVAGPVAAIGPIMFSHPQTAIAPSATRLQVVHAAAAAPGVSIYVTAPGAALGASTPLGTVSFKGGIGPTDVPSGQYEIRVTAAGTASPVLFDSGTITLAAGEDLLLAAVPNTGPGTAPIAIATVDQNGQNQVLLDVATPATLRVVHDVADSPPLSVIAVGSPVPPIVAGLGFPNFTGYLPESPGLYSLAVTLASNNGNVLLEQPLALNPGSQTTVYAVGPLAGISALVTDDGNNRRIATQAGLRIIHGSPSAGPVDVYLVATGSSVAAVAPLYASLMLGDDTDFQGVTAGVYDMVITPAGSKTAAIGPLTVTLKASGIYTAVARDAVGGGGPFGLILLDDFAP